MTQQKQKGPQTTANSLQTNDGFEALIPPARNYLPEIPLADYMRGRSHKQTAKKLKKLNWLYRHANSIAEQILILRLFEFYYQKESD